VAEFSKASSFFARAGKPSRGPGIAKLRAAPALVASSIFRIAIVLAAMPFQMEIVPPACQHQRHWGRVEEARNKVIEARMYGLAHRTRRS